MSTPGFWEIVLLVVVGLLLFGPDKLPGMARSVGRTIAQVKREASSALDELKQAADYEELRDVAGELRTTGQELRQASTDLVSPGGGGTDQAGALPVPAPFDPDAT